MTECNNKQGVRKTRRGTARRARNKDIVEKERAGGTDLIGQPRGPVTVAEGPQVQEPREEEKEKIPQVQGEKEKPKAPESGERSAGEKRRRECLKGSGRSTELPGSSTISSTWS
jgi:hypothetical protein